MSITLTQEHPPLTPLPEWFTNLREEGRKTFDALAMPTRKDEAWRFTDLHKLQIGGFGPAPTLDADAVAALEARSRGPKETAGRMVFANDRLVRREVFAEALSQQGVIWKPLEEALAAHPELVRRHFMAQGATLGGRKFAALHQAQVRNGTFLYVPQGVEIALPIEAHHWLSGENASLFPHTLLIAEAGSRVTLIDYFASASEEEAGLAVGVNDLYVAEGAQVTYVCVQEWSRRSLAFQINNTVVSGQATARHLSLNLGSAYARTESLSRLTGEGARSDMLSVTVADGDQEFDQRTLQEHCAPGAASDLLYKNAIDDRARTTFAGLIRVDEGAHRTDAYQKVRNLILSDDAEANSAPGLEILADDVRCTHGATSGQIEGEELFYLLARGIPEKEARRLIVRGFLHESVERLENPALAGHLIGRLDARFR